MTTDKELLELAAKAAGIKIYTQIGNTILCPVGGGDLLKSWNPLTDDGDALRLAVMLEINIQCEVLSTDASISSINCGGWSGVDGLDIPWAEEPLGTDPYAATRRAIVRAAAEIGKAA